MPGCHDRPVGINAGCKPGLVALRSWLRQRWPATLDWGCYNPRSRTDGGGWSLHAEGRAIDLGIPPARKADGDAIFAWCVANADGIGLQEIIWDRRVWSHRNPAVRPYRASPHTDHVHIGLCWAGANAATPWFRSGPSAPTVPVPQPDPAARTVWLQAAGRHKRRQRGMMSVWYGDFNHVFWVDNEGQLWHRYAAREPHPNPGRGVFADGRENMSVRYGVRERLDPAAGVVVDVLPGSILEVHTRTVTGDLIRWGFAPATGWGTYALRSR